MAARGKHYQRVAVKRHDQMKPEQWARRQRRRSKAQLREIHERRKLGARDEPEE